MVVSDRERRLNEVAGFVESGGDYLTNIQDVRNAQRPTRP